MPTQSYFHSTRIRDRVFRVVRDAFERARTQDKGFSFRRCVNLSDWNFVTMAIKRVLGKFDSGREFLQEQAVDHRCPRSTFFSALKSPRRNRVMQLIGDQVFRMLGQAVSEKEGVDYLAAFPELNDFSVLNGDGHFIKHSAHTRKKGGRTFAAGSIYLQDMRNGLTLPLCPVTHGDRKPHEIPVFKNKVAGLPADHFGRQKTLWVLDNAYTDHGWWEKQKRRGHFVITRLKTNYSALTCGEIPIDRSDPINVGVLNYRLAGFSSTGGCLTIVDVKDPENPEKCGFVSNLPQHFKPGLIAWLYFKRWNIEKNSDSFKNDLKENKAWAGGMIALDTQTQAIAMVYNILRTIHEIIAADEKRRTGRLTISQAKYAKGLERRENVAAKKRKKLYPFHRLLPRMSRIHSAFIRGFRTLFAANFPLKQAWHTLVALLFLHQ